MVNKKNDGIQIQYYKTLDVLKYVLAILIVSVHCNLFEENVLLHNFYLHVVECAVPTFFCISAFLFFRKIIDNPNEGKMKFLHSIKRLFTLYGIWIVLMLPISIPEFFMKATFKEILYVIPFRSSFSVYWFIKALIINVSLIYFLRKHLFACALISSLIYFYFAFDYIYGNLSDRIHPYYAFFYHTYAFVFGALIAKYENDLPNCFNNKYIIMVALVIVFIFSFIGNCRVVSKLLYPILLTLLALKTSVKIGFSKCRNMRTDSILFYMIHFSLVYIITQKFQIQIISVFRFMIVLTLLLIICAFYRFLERKTGAKFLRYLR